MEFTLSKEEFLGGQPIQPAPGRQAAGHRNRRPALVLAATICLLLGWIPSGCRQDAGEPADATAARSAGTGAAPDSASEIEEVRLARAVLASARVPIYPGVEGLDATEFEANTAPFVAVDFFSLDEPQTVVAFYDEKLKKLTARRDTALEPGAVRYEFERAFSGLSIRPWDPQGADSSALLARFDRRDAQGAAGAELAAYRNFLTRARTHIVVNVPRPEPEGGNP